VQVRKRELDFKYRYQPSTASTLTLSSHKTTKMPPSIPFPKIHIRPTPLTPNNFQKYGTLIQNPAHNPQNPTQCAVESSNQGSALKYIDITHLTNHYPQSPSKKTAKPVMNMFVSSPRKLRRQSAIMGEGDLILDIKILERHPYTPQTFIPLGLPSSSNTNFLIIVAPTLPSPNSEWPRGPGLPDLENIQAFLADGSQAITYGPGTWHAPMVVLGDSAVDFVVVQWANGVSLEDCQEILLEGGGVTVGIREFKERAKL
jgi:ureidoglycolate lyase